MTWHKCVNMNHSCNCIPAVQENVLRKIKSLIVNSKKSFYLCWVLVSESLRYETGQMTSENVMSHSAESWTGTLLVGRWRQGDSPLWIRRCSFRWCLYLKAFPHSLHLNLRFPAPSFSSGGCRQKNKEQSYHVMEDEWEADYEAVEQKLTGEFNSI